MAAAGDEATTAAEEVDEASVGAPVDDEALRTPPVPTGVAAAGAAAVGAALAGEAAVTEMVCCIVSWCCKLAICACKPPTMRPRPCSAATACTELVSMVRAVRCKLSRSNCVLIAAPQLLKVV